MSIHINLMGNKKHFGLFCAKMERVMNCRHPHCEKDCFAWAVRDVQYLCDGGVTINAAVDKWAETGLTHEDGEEILADLMGVDDLEVIRDLLKESGEKK